jgi:hypothetical protein
MIARDGKSLADDDDDLTIRLYSQMYHSRGKRQTIQWN